LSELNGARGAAKVDHGAGSASEGEVEGDDCGDDNVSQEVI
jgi:hypothetical protein